mmetsp:Transcript_19005/g.34527  ORF Transcript_19005/g.34527 Transcript_19005/m.34527 type:complete len:372 (+) Transcript_19005:69-1184(+)
MGNKQSREACRISKLGYSLTLVAASLKVSKNEVIRLISANTRISQALIEASFKLIDQGACIDFISQELHVSPEQLKEFLPSFLSNSEIAEIFSNRPGSNLIEVSPRYTYAVEYVRPCSITRLDMTSGHQQHFTLNSDLLSAKVAWTQDPRRNKLYFAYVEELTWQLDTMYYIRLKSADTLRDCSVLNLSRANDNLVRESLSNSVVYHEGSIYVVVCQQQLVQCRMYSCSTDKWTEVNNLIRYFIADSATTLKSTNTMYLCGSDVLMEKAGWRHQTGIVTLNLTSMEWGSVNLQMSCVPQMKYKEDIACFKTDGATLYFYLLNGLYSLDPSSEEVRLIKKYAFRVGNCSDRPCYVVNGTLFMGPLSFSLVTQ